MTCHPELVAAATVGTSHRAFDLSVQPAALRPEPVTGDAAVQLLDVAALAALAARTRPPTTAAPAERTPPPPDVLPVIPDVIRQVLGRISTQPAILLEALGVIHRAGVRLPPDMVPGLLDDPRPDVVSAARAVGGEIGRLLATMNPRWAEPVEPDPADRTAWDDGTVAQRISWLRTVRRVDPARCRELLQDNYSRETSAVRADLLAVLAQGLSGADQDLLLTAADDRSRAVAATALDLLSRLPGSPLRREMADLAARHLTVHRRMFRTTVVVSEPAPAEFSPWPAPDGHPWTVLLGRLDPADWPQVFGTDLLPLIAAGTPELQPLGPGFRQAAITHRHAGLAAVLVFQTLDRRDPKVPPTVDAALWAVLAPADAIAALDRLLFDRRVRPDQVLAAATTMTRPWPAATARRFARWLPSGGGSGAPAPRGLWELWAAATALPDCREMADVGRALTADAAGDHGQAVRTRASQALTLLTLRAVLYETLGPP